MRHHLSKFAIHQQRTLKTKAATRCKPVCCIRQISPSVLVAHENVNNSASALHVLRSVVSNVNASRLTSTSTPLRSIDG